MFVQNSDSWAPGQLHRGLWGWHLSGPKGSSSLESENSQRSPPHTQPKLPTTPTTAKCSRGRKGPLRSRTPPGARAPVPGAPGPQPRPHPEPFSSLLHVAAKEAEGAGGGNGCGRLLTQLRRLPSSRRLTVSEAVAGHRCGVAGCRAGPARGSLRRAPVPAAGNKTSSRAEGRAQALPDSSPLPRPTRRATPCACPVCGRPGPAPRPLPGRTGLPASGLLRPPSGRNPASALGTPSAC